MDKYFIHHAKPVSTNPDKISKQEIEKMVKFFKKFFSINEAPEIILTSNKPVAYITGEILNKICSGSQIMAVEQLNPGAACRNYDHILDLLDGYPTAAIIGHMPDISEFLSASLAEDFLNLKFNYGTICHVKDDEIQSLIHPDFLTK